MTLDNIADAIAAIAAGQPVIVADDEDRENEGDFILAAQLATTETIAFMVEHSSGLLCAPMSDEIADRLELPMMVTTNQDVRQTAYTSRSMPLPESAPAFRQPIGLTPSTCWPQPTRLPQISTGRATSCRYVPLPGRPPTTRPH